ncbi:MAG: ArsS family sensor histidine kinase [Campylobacterales bacterium]
MNIHSLAFKIVAVFVFVLVVFNGMFFAFVHTQKDLELKRVEKSYFELARQIIFQLRLGLSIEQIDHIKLLEPKRAKEFIDSSKTILDQIFHQNRGYRIYQKGTDTLMELRYKNNNYYIKNCELQTMSSSMLFFVYAVLNSVLFVAFLLIYRSITPLKKLQQEIEKFSNGDNIECKSNKKDEIADVANAFDSAAKKIKSLLESRVLFLRLIMHELKTPITKARIASEMLESGVNRDRIIKNLEKLNSQIDEFAKIERLNSKNLTLNLKPYTLTHVLEASYQLLLSDKNISESAENIDIIVDLEMMSIAFKNLIENALKHSSDKKCYIESDGKKLIFKSYGKKIEASMDEITKPYYSISNTQSESLGLGLYIVKEILKAHNLNLRYEHQDGYNLFFVELL